MNSLKAYKLKKEEAEQRKAFKKVCDSCVPDEYIELDNFILAVLEKLTDHCIESLEDLDQALKELEDYQSKNEIDNDYLGKYYKVSWANDEACMLFDNVDKAMSQFRYEIVFEADAKISVITKEEYDEIEKRCRRE